MNDKTGEFSKFYRSLLNRDRYCAMNYHRQQFIRAATEMSHDANSSLPPYNVCEPRRPMPAPLPSTATNRDPSQGRLSKIVPPLPPIGYMRKMAENARKRRENLVVQMINEIGKEKASIEKASLVILNQLHGGDKSPGGLNDDCDPYKTFENGSTFGYAPCGAIANSLFNDSFTIDYQDKNVSVGLIKTGIAWVSDKNVKFNNPSSWTNFIKPPNWEKPVWELDTADPDNNGYENEDLIVWMRTAASPTFRKLYRRVNHTIAEFSNGLPAGQYKIAINYSYPVTAFDGTKSIIISTTSWLGGKNSFLGIAYVVVGSLCIVLGVIFLLPHPGLVERTHF